MNKSIRQGETYIDTIISDDASAETVELVVSDSDGNVIIDETASFSEVDGKTTAVIQTDDTFHPVGDYEYMYIITYSDGVIKHLPDASECGDDCALPTLTICKSLSAEVS